jgi:hypothetical protein
MKIVPRFSEDKEMLFLFTGRNCPPMFIQCPNNTTQLFWDIDCHHIQDFENWDIVYYDTVDSFRENDEDRIIGEHSKKQKLTKEFWDYVFSVENRNVSARII